MDRINDLHELSGKEVGMKILIKQTGSRSMENEWLSFYLNEIGPFVKIPEKSLYAAAGEKWAS